MAALTDVAWFFEPLQAFVIIATAFNAGGSTLQSPLVMPMLMLPNIPTHYAAQQTAYLLHNSEYFFPPLNGVCTLANVLMTSISYYYSSESAIASAKLPKLAVAAAANLATTAWALGIMVPMNKKMTVLAGELKRGAEMGEDKEPLQKQKETELRSLQNRWRNLNYGRAAIMIASAAAGVSALVARV